MARSKRRRGNRSVVAQFSHLLSVVIWSINLLSIHEKRLLVGAPKLPCVSTAISRVCVRSLSVPGCVHRLRRRRRRVEVYTLVVFMSVAMFDRNVGACFIPVMSYDTKQVFNAVPLAGGVVGALLFAAFPSTRHGLGFPIPAAGAA